eukprot:jgi/Chlat1/7051/Chrsp56S06710
MPVALSAVDAAWAKYAACSGAGAAEAEAPVQQVAEQASTAPSAAIEVTELEFTYPGLDGRPPPGASPLIKEFNLRLAPGERQDNTAADTCGHAHGAQRVLDRSAFHDTNLTASGAITYLGTEWRRALAFAGGEVPLQADIAAKDMLQNAPGADQARLAELMKVMDINPHWRMNKVSDGQRRRVQICMGLAKPFKVLLLDEITVDLDVIGRADLLNYLKKECEERGACVIYATHIFDGIDTWPTHLAYVAEGRLQVFDKLSAIKELRQQSLMETIAVWLRKDREVQKAKRLSKLSQKQEVDGIPVDERTSTLMNNGWTSGRLTPSVKK